MELHEIAKNVKSKEDFLHFIDALRNDLERNPSEWENKSLTDYLEALQRSTEDMEGYYSYNNIPLPIEIPWNIFTNILMTAKMYE